MEYLPVKRLSYKSATSTVWRWVDSLLFSEQKADAKFVIDLMLAKDGSSNLARRYMLPSPFAEIHIDRKPFYHRMQLEDGMR